MKKENMEFLIDKGLDIVETTKMGYSEIRIGKGKSLWITEKPPLNPAMLADFYEFTMMAAYIESGKTDEIATFNAFYRKNPFGGGFTIFLGLEKIIEYLEQFQFTGRDIDHMRKSWKMPESFYEYIREINFSGTVEALPDGTMAQPYLPLLQVTAPLPIANFIETYVLNQIGFPTLVATKAARLAVQTEKPFLEFGLRRVQGGMEGGLTASRAAYIGGAAKTSNVLAEQVYGIPASGTIAHSFIMSFPTQKEAFEAYANVFKENSVFLIDTYGYETGVKDAVDVSRKLKMKTFTGVRDDSGDLAYQSKIIRKILDDNGFRDVKIAVSNEIDEIVVRSLKEQDAKIDLFGIGTRLVTADTSPSLGIVYKLVQSENRCAIKISGNREKVTDPGKKKVYRLMDENNMYAADVILTDKERLGSEITVYNRMKEYESKKFDCVNGAIPLLKTVIKEGSIVCKTPALNDIKQKVKDELDRIWPEVKRIENPAEYLVGFSPAMKKLKNNIIKKYVIKK